MAANDQDVRRAARILVVRGIQTMRGFRLTPSCERGYLVEELKKTGYAYLQLRVAHQLFDPPEAPRNETGNRRVEIEEVRIRLALKSYTPSLPGLSALWRHGQCVANFPTADTARAASVVPEYVDYPAPDITKKPRIPSDRAHGRLLSSWGANIRACAARSL